MKSLSFFQKIMAIYLVGFIVPMVLNMTYYASYGYNYKGYNGAVTLTCFIIAAITLFVFFFIELLQYLTHDSDRYRLVHNLYFASGIHKE